MLLDMCICSLFLNFSFSAPPGVILTRVHSILAPKTVQNLLEGWRKETAASLCVSKLLVKALRE